MKQKIDQVIKTLRRQVRRHRLLSALLLAIGATCVLTGISLTMYKLGGFSRYDLSRPGYEKERSEIVTDKVDSDFSASGELTAPVVKTFLEQLDDHRDDMQSYNTFGTGGLSNEDLGITR